jgi:hypothetical protein
MANFYFSGAPPNVVTFDELSVGRRCKIVFSVICLRSYPGSGTIDDGNVVDDNEEVIQDMLVLRATETEGDTSLNASFGDGFFGRVSVTDKHLISRITVTTYSQSGEVEVADAQFTKDGPKVRLYETPLEGMDANELVAANFDLDFDAFDALKRLYELDAAAMSYVEEQRTRQPAKVITLVP